MKYPVAHVRKLILSVNTKRRILKSKNKKYITHEVLSYWKNQGSATLPSYFYEPLFIKLNGESFYIDDQKITKFIP